MSTPPSSFQDWMKWQKDCSSQPQYWEQHRKKMSQLRQKNEELVKTLKTSHPPGEAAEEKGGASKPDIPGKFG